MQQRIGQLVQVLLCHGLASCQSFFAERNTRDILHGATLEVRHEDLVVFGIRVLNTKQILEEEHALLRGHEHVLDG